MELPKSLGQLYMEMLERLSKNTGYIKTKYEIFYNRLRLNQGTIVSIGARPGHGKTTFRNALIWDIIKNNPEKRINIIDFQLDMDPIALLEKDIKRLGFDPKPKKVSVIPKDHEQEKDQIAEHLKRLLSNCDWKVITSIPDIKSMEAWSDSMLTEMTKINPGKQDIINIVTLDFALMVPTSKEKGIDLVSLMHCFQRIRNKHKALCIVLTQLNREVNEKTRIKNGVFGNRIMDKDFYGSDAFLQYSDLVIGLDVPALRGISLWSEKQIPVTDKHVIINIIKDRITGTLESFIYLKDNLDFKYYEKVENLDETSISVEDNNSQEINDNLSEEDESDAEENEFATKITDISDNTETDILF